MCTYPCSQRILECHHKAPRSVEKGLGYLRGRLGLSRIQWLLWDSEAFLEATGGCVLLCLLLFGTALAGALGLPCWISLVYVKKEVFVQVVIVGLEPRQK